MIRWNLFFEVEKIKQLALIDRLATHHDRPRCGKLQELGITIRRYQRGPFSTGSTQPGRRAERRVSCWHPPIGVGDLRNVVAKRLIMTTRRSIASLAITATAALALTSAASAFPDKLLQFVTPYPFGG